MVSPLFTQNQTALVYQTEIILCSYILTTFLGHNLAVAFMTYSGMPKSSQNRALSTTD